MRHLTACKISDNLSDWIKNEMIFIVSLINVANINVERSFVLANGTWKEADAASNSYFVTRPALHSVEANSKYRSPAYWSCLHAFLTQSVI